MRNRNFQLAAIGAAITGLLAVAASPAAATAQHHVDRSVRVMQWNIQGAVGVGGPTLPDPARIAAVIAAEGPDIVTLDEVHQDPTDAGTYDGDQPAQLAQLLADDGYLYSQWGLAESDTPRGPDSTTGNLILSKYPFVGSADLTKLPNENYEPGGKDRRSMIQVTVDVPGVGEIAVAATHLSTPGSAALVEDQKDQVRIVLDHVDTSTPSILAGDFNIRASDVETQTFSQNNLMQSWIAQAGLVDTWRQVRNGQDGVSMTSAYGSPSGQNPDRRIDYVFASPSFDVIDGHMSTIDLSASDHVAVVMDLALSSAANRTRTVLAGDEGVDGWAQLTETSPANVKLSVCKNTGTAVDDGTSVHAYFRNAGGQAIKELTDSGTTRGSCETTIWRGKIPAKATVDVQVVDGDGTVLSTRSARF
jgi:endonuclease/exonuclease/phosphatase family metal-dependent hydrolase